MKKIKNFTETRHSLEFFKKTRTSMIELAVAIGMVNLVVAILFRSWCNKRIKDMQDMQDKWKK